MKGAAGTPRAENPTAREALANTLTTPSGTIRLRRLGAGKPILCLHDLGESLTSFDEILPRLAQKYQVLAVDLLGHGESSIDALDLSIPAQTEAVREIIHELDLGDVTLVGHSLGGSVAIRVAALEPERTRKLVLLSSGCYEYRYPLSWRVFRSRVLWHGASLIARARLLRAMAAVKYGEASGREDFIARWLAAPAARWAALGRGFRQTTSQASLAEMEEVLDHFLAVPTLVLWGSRDLFHPAAPARRLFQEKPGVRFLEIEDGSHALHVEAPEIVAELILDFLE